MEVLEVEQGNGIHIIVLFLDKDRRFPARRERFIVTFIKPTFGRSMVLGTADVHTNCGTVAFT
jgi:hypothetical protein